MSERLSVEMAREHAETGHGGRYEPYCYRCQYWEERRDAASWELLAITKRRIWWSGWPHWTRIVGIGSDEFWRYTIWVGPVVIALWSMWMSEDLRAHKAALRDIESTDEGQVDRDKQVKRP